MSVPGGASLEYARVQMSIGISLLDSRLGWGGWDKTIKVNTKVKLIWASVTNIHTVTFLSVSLLSSGYLSQSPFLYLCCCPDSPSHILSLKWWVLEETSNLPLSSTVASPVPLSSGQSEGFSSHLLWILSLSCLKMNLGFPLLLGRSNRLPGV